MVRFNKIEVEELNAALRALASIGTITPSERDEINALPDSIPDFLLSTASGSLSAISKAHPHDAAVQDAARGALARLSRLTGCDDVKPPTASLFFRLPENEKIEVPSEPRIDFEEEITYVIIFVHFYRLLDPQHIPLAAEMRSLLKSISKGFDRKDFKRLWAIIDELWNYYQKEGMGYRVVRDRLREIMYDMGGKFISGHEAELANLLSPA